jgi:hypothetical protein
MVQQFLESIRWARACIYHFFLLSSKLWHDSIVPDFPFLVALRYRLVAKILAFFLDVYPHVMSTQESHTHTWTPIRRLFEDHTPPFPRGIFHASAHRERNPYVSCHPLAYASQIPPLPIKTTSCSHPSRGFLCHFLYMLPSFGALFPSSRFLEE